eukprot:s557_g26.t1
MQKVCLCHAEHHQYAFRNLTWYDPWQLFALPNLDPSGFYHWTWKEPCWAVSTAAVGSIGRRSAVAPRSNRSGLEQSLTGERMDRFRGQ